MMRKFFSACLLIASAIFCACDDNTGLLGWTLIDNMDHLDVTTDTFEVQTRSIVVDSVLARNITGYMGKVRDPESGAYVTGDFMTQFHTFEMYEFPEDKLVLSRWNDMAAADSCELRLFYTSWFGDSLATMKLHVYELDRPMTDGRMYYSSYDPEKEGYIRKDGISVSKTYSIVDLSVSDYLRWMGDYTENIKVNLNDPYTDRDGKTYNNYGTYMMQKYYEDKSNYKNDYTFLNRVTPGFYFKHQGGMGAMAYVLMSQLNVFFTYKDAVKDTTYVGTAAFSGTEEVLQTTRFTNDKNTIARLAADNSCTYIKTPAGIFTEVTLPIDEIMSKHKTDTINSAKIEFLRVNNDVQSQYALPAPTRLAIMPKDSLYSFFEHNQLLNYKNSFKADYSSTTNSYVFNNIGALIKFMYEQKQAGKASEDWNKAVLVPITTEESSNSKSETIITKVTNDMSMSSTKLVGGPENKRSPIKISVIYSKFK